MENTSGPGTPSLPYNCHPGHLPPRPLRVATHPRRAEYLDTLYITDEGRHLTLSRQSSHYLTIRNVREVEVDASEVTPTQADFPSLGTISRAHGYPSMAANTPARTGVSPSSSPRLPSPPPFTEVQIGPTSPTIVEGNQDHQLVAPAGIDDGASRRIRPGTRAADMASGPPLVPLSELDSPFQFQEHLKALHNTYTRTPNGNTTPITRETAQLLATPPLTSPRAPPVDRHLWLYELCRFLTMKANCLIVAFFAESPPCSASTCPEMRASEWQYLCAVHDPPKSCCAIDYCCHTLDWATNILTSPKYFPSRLTIGTLGSGNSEEGTGGRNVGTSMRHLTNIFRRVYRIFAHAWFQHRAVFWQVEATEGLYIFFKTVCDVYSLIPEDNYTIPGEAEGILSEEGEGDGDMETPVNTTSPAHGLANDGGLGNGSADESKQMEGEATTTVSVGATTRRHKHTPSTGTNVTTIAEGTEEDEDVGGFRDAAAVIRAEEEDEEKQNNEEMLAAKESSTGASGPGKLDLSPGSLPEFQAPEDPTPQASRSNFDPMEAFVPKSPEAEAEEGKTEDAKRESDEEPKELSHSVTAVKLDDEEKDPADVKEGHGESTVKKTDDDDATEGMIAPVT